MSVQPLEIENVQPLEIEIVQPLELEIEIVFECTICFITDVKFPTKYNCSNCTKKICNDCFARHILTKINCVFCRSPLILDKKDIDIHLPHPAYIYLCVRYGKVTCTAVCIMTTWYIFLFVFMLEGFSGGTPIPYGKAYNYTDPY
jgi:hypothetical protein